MLRRTHVEPFLRLAGDRLEVESLRAGREDDALPPALVAFLDRLTRLVRRLEGRPRSVVREALARQERRVRDVRRLAGLAKVLEDACVFRPEPGAEHSPDIREAVFLARGKRWPPLPGDEEAPYRDAADALGRDVAGVRKLLYADRPDRYRLVRAPRWDGRALLDRYDLELARAVLLDAESVVLRADGGWKRTFRALKLSRLMTRVEREGRRRYRVEVTGPAAPFVGRPQRYGVRLARALPALLAAPGAMLEARVHHEGRVRPFYVTGAAHPTARRRGRRHDSAWEEDLAGVLEEKLEGGREGWSLHREDRPVTLPGGAVFLPDFTLRHRDGREALVELVGFWTPEYLAAKARKVRAAGLDNLVLVVSRKLAEGAGELEEASLGPVVWFTDRPVAGPVLEAAERVAR